tara:strand:+ start:1652 stop:2503 length:852 start_codon:yes stop_codon:yes gene_type:complete
MLKNVLVTTSIILICLATQHCTKEDNQKEAASEELILPRSSFVRIEKKTSVRVCDILETKVGKGRRKKIKKTKICLEGDFGFTASGFSVTNDDTGTYIATAAHMCYDAEEALRAYEQKFHGVLSDNVVLEKESNTFLLHDIYGDVRQLEIVDLSASLDLCLMYAKGAHLPPVKSALRDPTIGEEVYNLAAPAGFSFENMVPILKGYYSGYNDTGSAIYTIPAFGGSSGSPIVNRRGEYLGMIVSIVGNFEHISLSPTRRSIRTFISDVLKNGTCGEVYHSSLL